MLVCTIHGFNERFLCHWAVGREMQTKQRKPKQEEVSRTGSPEHKTAFSATDMQALNPFSYNVLDRRKTSLQEAFDERTKTDGARALPGGTDTRLDQACAPSQRFGSSRNLPFPEPGLG